MRFSIASLGAFLSLAATPAFALQPLQASFPDVPTNHENYQAIEYLRKNNIVQGYPDGTFGPERRINRAEFVKIAASPYILRGVRVEDCVRENIRDESQFVFFPDVMQIDWFAPYVCSAKVMNLVDGYPDGTFKPSNYISFVESAKIFTNIFIGNLASDPIWYKPYVEELAKSKAIPTSIRSFDVKLTRGDMAEMIYRLKAPDMSKKSLTYEDLEK